MRWKDGMLQRLSPSPAVFALCSLLCCRRPSSLSLSLSLSPHLSIHIGQCLATLTRPNTSSRAHSSLNLRPSASARPAVQRTTSANTAPHNKLNSSHCTSAIAAQRTTAGERGELNSGGGGGGQRGRKEWRPPLSDLSMATTPQETTDRPVAGGAGSVRLLLPVLLLPALRSLLHIGPSSSPSPSTKLALPVPSSSRRGEQSCRS